MCRSPRLFLAGLLLPVFLAGSAAAAPIGYYADVFTSNLLGNVHARGTLVLDESEVGPLNPVGFESLSLGIQLGQGLGSGYVGDNESIVITHTFLPSTEVYSIESVWLSLALADDLLDPLVCTGFFQCSFEDEYALISVDGSDIWSGDAGQGWVLGQFVNSEITGTIQSVGDSVQVVVSSTGGDFSLRGTALAVAFSGSESAPPIPEPASLLLFSLGSSLVISVGSLTRRRSAS